MTTTTDQRAALLEELRSVIADVDQRDREERQRRVRSAYGFAKDRPVPDELIHEGALTSYQVMVRTGEYRDLQVRAAACLVLAGYLADPSINALLGLEESPQ
jgi:hypothetical protein